MGGKSGGGAQTPHEAPNTMNTAQYMRIIDAICEGEAAGFGNGDSEPLKSVFFNDTPVQNADGTFAFKGVKAYFNRGTPDQTYIPSFDSTERTVSVAAQVKKATPISRAVTDPLVNRVRVTLGINRNIHIDDKGNTNPTTTSVRVELVNNQGVQKVKNVRFTEKASGQYYVDTEFKSLPSVPFNIRVSRLSADPKNNKTVNDTYFSSFVECIDAKLAYPNTAIAALKIDSAQFGTSAPRRNYLIKGRLVKVPSNYDPETREYTGLWDGSFKTAWTDNPAWIFYDLLINERFSNIARRLTEVEIDRFALYNVAKYCDELVDDGFGGKEPRFVCNAYITDQKQAGELLNDLASVFTGLSVWNGAQVGVVIDKADDPVALYSNANVVDGLFSYSSAALKNIYTAIQVKYSDANDAYRSKTEYVSDDEAIKRYGYNLKAVTAFGCTSRGQAARFGAWVLQTSLRQQNAISFTVGREGLRHLPYDIIEVADNHYVGAQIGGRVQAVDSTTITLDRELHEAAGALLQFSDGQSVQTVRVRAANGNQLTLAHAVALKAGDLVAVSGQVKTRLYRCTSITESDEGTYNIAALLHEPEKYQAVDNWVKFDNSTITLYNTQPQLTSPTITTNGTTWQLNWDNLTADGESLTYQVVIYRDGVEYKRDDYAKTPNFSLEGLRKGNYIAVIRGRNARGVLSEPLTKAWQVDFEIRNLRTTSKTLAIGVDWSLPELASTSAHTELWYAQTNDFNQARKLVDLPCPQTSYTLTGVQVSDEYYFWARMVGADGSSGEYTAAVRGVCDSDPAPIINQIQGAINQSALAQELIDSLNAQAAAAAGEEVSRESQILLDRLDQEATTRAREVKLAADKAARDLATKAAEIGTRVSAVETVNNQQVQQLSSVTAAQGNTAAALEQEKKARAAGDAAQAQERKTLATRVGSAEGRLNNVERTATEAKQSVQAVSQDLGGRVGRAESGITQLRQSVQNETQVTTEKLNNAISRIGVNEGKISQVEQTKAGKNEVSSLARTSLASEWKAEIQAAKREAIATAATTAQQKADAAKDAAQIAAMQAAQAKADAAKSAAIAAASSDAQAKANAAKAAAIADAAAKDAVLKQQAATDAQNKANAAKAAAIAEAQKLNTATDAKITALQKTFTSNQQAVAQQINNLSASVRNGNNLLVNTEFASPDSQGVPEGYTKTNAAGVYAYHNLTNSSWTYALRDGATYTLRDNRSVTGNKVAYVTCKLRIPVKAGQIFQFSCYVAGWNLNPNSGNLLYFDFRDSKDKGVSINPRVKRGRYTYGAANTGSTQKIGEYGRRAAADVYTTLDKFEQYYVNEQIPEGVDYINIGIALRSRDNLDAFLVLARPQLCEVGSLDAPLVPYGAGSNSASVQEVRRSYADLSGKVSATYSLKTSTISGGRKVVTGLAFGVDGATGDSQFLVQAQNFAVVPAGSNTIKPMFTVTGAGNSAKVAVNGDLIADGTILGRHIKANQTIVAPSIQGATLQGGTLNIGNGKFEVDSSGNMSAENAFIRGTVSGQLAGATGEFKPSVISGNTPFVYPLYQLTTENATVVSPNDGNINNCWVEVNLVDLPESTFGYRVELSYLGKLYTNGITNESIFGASIEGDVVKAPSVGTLDTLVCDNTGSISDVTRVIAHSVGGRTKDLIRLAKFSTPDVVKSIRLDEYNKVRNTTSSSLVSTGDNSRTCCRTIVSRTSPSMRFRFRSLIYNKSNYEPTVQKTQEILNWFLSDCAPVLIFTPILSISGVRRFKWVKLPLTDLRWVSGHIGTVTATEYDNNRLSVYSISYSQSFYALRIKAHTDVWDGSSVLVTMPSGNQYSLRMPNRYSDYVLETSKVYTERSNTKSTATFKITADDRHTQIKEIWVYTDA